MWKDVKSFEGLYKISDKGEIKCLPKKAGFHNRPRRMMKPKLTKFGYKAVTLMDKGIAKYVFVHRLVAENFITNPKNKSQVNHIDGNKQNNNVKNLEWVTCSENHKHMYRTGLRSMKGENHNNRKLNAKQALEIYKSKDNNSVLAKKYNVCKATISRIKNGKNWDSVTNK